MTFRVTVACMAEQSRPNNTRAQFAADLATLKLQLGSCGIAGMTEFSHPNSDAALADSGLAYFQPQPRLGRRVDCAQAWSPGWRLIAHGYRFGSRAIRIVAPTRWTTWTLLELADADLTIAHINTHMVPGGYGHPKEKAQRLHQHLIRLLWHRHERRIERLIETMRHRADIVIATGDINHPGEFTFPGMRRLSRPSIVYIGAIAGHTGAQFTTSPVTVVRNNSDHPMQVVSLEIS